MAFFIFTIIFVTLGIFIILKTSKKDEPQPQQRQQVHFGLLNGNGDPVKHEHIATPTTRQRVVEKPEVKNIRYFSIKDKGYHVSVWPKDSNNWLPGLDYVEFNIAGMSHQDNIDKYLGEHVGKLMPEPTNPFDANAIKILSKDGHQVGYVPKDMTSSVRKFTNLPCKCYFYIGENDGTYFSSCYITK